MPNDPTDATVRATQDDNTMVGRVDPLPRPNSVPIAPGYTVEKELGRGGMGVVFRARQVSLNRPVALKLLLSADYAGAQELARFKAEADAVSRLQHPNVVAIYEIGECAGKPYFSMELCAGGSLAERILAKPFAIREAVETMLKISRGVAAAHAAGIVHRDLKPQNVLLSADNEPKVTDFGLAKLTGADERDNNMTKTGAVMGTPNYMSPEQASGLSKRVGPPADVFALGVMLYELLTGRTPFRASTTIQTLQMVVSEDAVSPRVHRPEVPRDLEAVCLKCLSKDPARRYQTGAELVQDLARFLAGEAVSATQSGLVDQVANALDRVQLEERFATDGKLLLALAPMMFLPDIPITWIIANNLPSHWMAVIQFARVFGFILMVGYFRNWRYKPLGVVERNLSVLWGGYLMACVVYGIGLRIGLRSLDTHLELQIYFGITCMTGMAFISMAATFWGYCAFIGIAFFAAAGLMSIDMRFAPLLFGTTWGIVLVLLGTRLRKLARHAE